MAFERAGFSERMSVFPALTFGLSTIQPFLPFLLCFIGSAAFDEDACLVFSGFSGHINNGGQLPSSPALVGTFACLLSPPASMRLYRPTPSRSRPALAQDRLGENWKK